MSLPADLQRLPPQVHDVIRYLGRQESNGALIDDIMDDMDMTERTTRKWLRRMVTRYYAEMPVEGYYVLTANGVQAAQTLFEYDGATPSEAAAAVQPQVAPATLAADAPQPTGPAPASAPSPASSEPQLLVVVPRELIAQQAAQLKVGFDHSGAAAASGQPVRAIVRIHAPGCDVDPVERAIDVALDRVAGPLAYTLVPRAAGQVRVKIEVFQVVAQHELVPAGGMYFDLSVASFPTPRSGEKQALGADVDFRAEAAV